MKNKIIITSVILALSGTLFASGTAAIFFGILNHEETQTMSENNMHRLVVSEWTNLTDHEKTTVAEVVDNWHKQDTFTVTQRDNLKGSMPNNPKVIESLLDCIKFWRMTNKNKATHNSSN